ncbi:MAG: carboxypeptidase-like regulatory domain-containing protein, partial [Bryobacteraceae bacterium]
MLKKFAIPVALAPVALAMLLCSQPAQAQELGNISGVVSDASGSVIPSAQVKVTNDQTDVTRNVVTNSSGHYNAPDLVIGKYTIAISAKGFKTYRQTGIPVNVNANLRIDARLQIGGVQQTVEVQANAVQIQTEDATVGQVV